MKLPEIPKFSVFCFGMAAGAILELVWLWFCFG